LKIRLLATPLVAVSLAACAGTRTSEPASPRTDESLEALEALYRARIDSATMSVHEADVRFMTGMVAHHAQALVMSHIAPDNGASTEIRVLTGRIINAQRDEISVMQTWLRDRGLPAPEVDEMGHVSMGGDHSMHMQGMLTPEQLDELRAARGPEFDRLFLTYMIQHHNGAVSMVHELFATDGAAQDDLVFKLASDIQVDQTTEVARMERMLDALQRGPTR
jgi:uncharacterized protein (DUF305 family)